MQEKARIKQEQVQQAWDDVAAGYDEFVTPTHLPVSEYALRLAGLQQGMRFLDVAAGSGALSITAARWGADVLATDISPIMVERLCVRARGEGLSNLEGRVMGGHELALDDGAFDISGSQYGVMLFPDLPRGLAEMVRVTKEELEFRSAPDLWHWLTNSNPIGAQMVAGISTEQKASAQRALDRMLDERAGGDGPAILSNLTHIAVGTK
jgi:ubiquinone/menaquinone biosynthesis C-methylase UbiE